MNLKDLLQLSGENGKAVIVGDDGEVKGVFLSFEEYQRLNKGRDGHGKSVLEKKPKLDPEKVNREILDAQLTDTLDLDNKNLEIVSSDDSVSTESSQSSSHSTVSAPTPIKNILHKRAKDLFINQPYGRQEPPEYDIREEVMDPTFGQPIVETESDEEIKPNFDDI